MHKNLCNALKQQDTTCTVHHPAFPVGMLEAVDGLPPWQIFHIHLNRSRLIFPIGESVRSYISNLD